MLSCEWLRGRCMSQRDVTCDSWQEAVERHGWRWDSHGESFSSEYRSELYSPLGGVLRMKSIRIIFKTGSRTVGFWGVFKLNTILNLHRSFELYYEFWGAEQALIQPQVNSSGPGPQMLGMAWTRSPGTLRRHQRAIWSPPHGSLATGPARHRTSSYVRMHRHGAGKAHASHAQTRTPQYTRHALQTEYHSTIEAARVASVTESHVTRHVFFGLGVVN